jgi:hypothetical protein
MHAMHLSRCCTLWKAARCLPEPWDFKFKSEEIDFHFPRVGWWPQKPSWGSCNLKIFFQKNDKFFPLLIVFLRNTCGIMFPAPNLYWASVASHSFRFLSLFSKVILSQWKEEPFIGLSPPRH